MGHLSLRIAALAEQKLDLEWLNLTKLIVRALNFLPEFFGYCMGLDFNLKLSLFLL